MIGIKGEHLGDIERIFMDPIEARATHILISDGFLFKEKKLIPIRWMTYALEDEVHLSVDANLVDGLPEYEYQS